MVIPANLDLDMTQYRYGQLHKMGKKQRQDYCPGWPRSINPTVKKDVKMTFTLTNYNNKVQ